MSGEGSALIASICDADFIEELKQRETYRNPENIMSGWKWGCPGEPGQVRARIIPELHRVAFQGCIIVRFRNA